MDSRRNGAGVGRAHAGIHTERRVAQAFATALRSACERLGLSLDEVADCSGFEPGYRSRLERGLQDPTLCDFLRLCVTLGVAPSRLLEETIEASVGQRFGRADVIQLREIWMAFLDTVSQRGQDEPVAVTVLAAQLLDELARRGLAVVALPVHRRERSGHA